MAPTPAIDVQALQAALAERIAGEALFDDGQRAAYSTDASNYRHVPIGVVRPRSAEDVVAAVEVCRRFGAPITCRGGGTSLAGQACNVAVVFDFSRHMHRVLEIDAEARIARVEPGCVLDTLRDRAAEHGLTFGPDPATHDRNTLGGMIGNDSCGIHSVMAEFYGPGPRTAHSVESLEVLTYSGLRLQVGATGDDELQRLLAAGGERAEIHRQLLQLRDRHAEAIRARFPSIPRRVSGYGLDWLLPENGFHVARALVGSEGTCVLVLSATLRLIPRLPERTLVVLGYPDVFSAGDHVPQIREHRPVGIEGIDEQLVDHMQRKGLHPQDVALLPEGKGWLLVEFGAETKAEADAQAQRLREALQRGDDPPHVKVFDDDWEEQKLWQVRESGLGATARVPGMHPSHPGWEDAAVPPEAIGTYLRQFRALLQRYGYRAALYGHFGQGCVHCRIDFELRTAKGIAQWRAFLDEAADLVISHGGSMSGEHGDGQARGALLPKMYGETLVGAMRDFRRIWDPDNHMNPGRVVDAPPPERDLRLGTDYAPWVAKTHFAFTADHGNFASAADRCAGVGLCRREGGGVMCPSYQVTREEQHSTRGRARLLFEMMRGDLVRDRWRSKAVLEALELCLSCKACRHECPVNVDMATYKAEFLSHHYAWRLRPRAAYSMGLIHLWAGLGARLPRLTNFLGRTPPFASILKLIGGIAAQRRVPQFATQTFRRWFRSRPGAGEPAAARPAAPRGKSRLQHRDVPRFAQPTFGPRDDGDGEQLSPQASAQGGSARRVLLWADTFSDNFEPHIARAATASLTALGFRVEVPQERLCCGRPLYDWGFLDRAKRSWRRTLQVLRAEIRAGTPVVGLEPSCIAAFRDELPGLFPHDEDARRLSRQAMMLSELLEQQDVDLPQLHRRAVVHGHCHHKAVMHLDAEVAVLKRLELDYQLLDSGCCGMAGAFGFDRRHYDVSIGCGERVLLPAVRNADAETLIIANGFSCRQQIEQTTGRRALHLAEVLQLALASEANASLPTGRRAGAKTGS